jgi:hypothetical protein
VGVERFRVEGTIRVRALSATARLSGNLRRDGLSAYQEAGRTPRALIGSAPAALSLPEVDGASVGHTPAGITFLASCFGHIARPTRATLRPPQRWAATSLTCGVVG